MQHQIQKDNSRFFQMSRSRLSNPTFISSNVQDSLTNFNRPSDYTKKLIKQTEYRSRFVSMYSQNIPIQQLKPINYAKFSKAAFQKRSRFSSVGSNLLNEITNNTKK